MKTFLTSFRVILVTTLLTGALYPAIVTVLGQALFSHKAKGSLIQSGDSTVGSELIAQAFGRPEYFWPRPSAVKYDAASSGASNLGLTSSDLQKSIKEREQNGMVLDLRFSSGSGLDPHISPEAANAQLERIGQARKLNITQTEQLVELIAQHVEGRQFGVLGEPRVNVLKLNIALDRALK